MQFPDSDEEKEPHTEEGSIQSAPTLSLHEHFATTNNNDYYNTVKGLKVGSKMDASIPETADMTDMASSFQHVQKIEVKLLDDCSELKQEEEYLIPSQQQQKLAATAGHDDDKEAVVMDANDDEHEPPVVLERAPDILARDDAVAQEAAPLSKSDDKHHPPKKSLNLADGLRLLRELAFDFASDGHLEVENFVEGKSTGDDDDDDDDDGKPNEGSGLLVGV
jgi:hypothetical protein